jgi:hypothetical protein
MVAPLTKFVPVMLVILTVVSALPSEGVMPETEGAEGGGVGGVVEVIDGVGTAPDPP